MGRDCAGMSFAGARAHKARRARSSYTAGNGDTQTGIDVLKQQHFAALRGKRASG